jgi:phosphate acyltransferase
MLSIAVDAMGGDLGPRAAFRAIEKLLRKQKDISIRLFVEQEWRDDAELCLQKYALRCHVVVCGQTIAADEKPMVVMRHREDSSMFQALLACRNGECQGVLSVGSTGALMILSRHILGVLPGIDRPALATRIPTRSKPLLMLDLGATLSASTRNLVQFAVLGVAWCRSMGLDVPTVGLLNVGNESGKGTEEIRAAHQVLTDCLPENYAGFFEGDDLYRGQLDVMVCDGFTGNVALKTSEGLTEWLTWMLRQELRSHWVLRLMKPFWRRMFRRVHEKIAPSRHGGALLLGVDGIVVKTHGKSDASTYEYAMRYLLRQVQNHDRSALIEQISRVQLVIT